MPAIPLFVIDSPGSERRGRGVLVASCGAHLIQDGLVALQYVLLPILAQTFSLNYAQIGLLRAVSSGAMTALEVPAGVLAERLGETRLLIFGLFCAALGYLGVAFAVDFQLMVLAFLVAGCGAAFQHSLASALIANFFDDASRRRSLGLYNAFGDVGKLAFTGIFSLAIGIGFAWDLVVTALCLVAIAFTATLLPLARDRAAVAHREAAVESASAGTGKWGIKQPREFSWLCLTIFLDSLVQAVFFTFIAFLLLAKGGGEALASLGVVLTLCGGMIGKLASGYLAVRYGDRGAFRILQLMTVAGIVILLFLPVLPALLVLPLLGIALQGSSTVTYGAVSDFVDRRRQSRGYALMYSLSGISTVIGPMAFGGLADLYGIDVAFFLLAVATGLTLPCARVLQVAPPLANFETRD
jgi:MFS family permease